MKLNFINYNIFSLFLTGLFLLFSPEAHSQKGYYDGWQRQHEFEQKQYKFDLSEPTLYEISDDEKTISHHRTGYSIRAMNETISGEETLAVAVHDGNAWIKFWFPVPYTDVPNNYPRDWDNLDYTPTLPVQYGVTPTDTSQIGDYTFEFSDSPFFHLGDVQYIWDFKVKKDGELVFSGEVLVKYKEHTEFHLQYRQIIIGFGDMDLVVAKRGPEWADDYYFNQNGDRVVVDESGILDRSRALRERTRGYKEEANKKRRWFRRSN